MDVERPFGKMVSAIRVDTVKRLETDIVSVRELSPFSNQDSMKNQSRKGIFDQSFDRD